MNQRRWIGAAGLALWLASGWALRAETYYVAEGGDDSRSGIGDWANALATISNAVALAGTPGDRVLVSNGTYTLSKQVSIDKDLAVVGAGPREAVIVNGGGASRCFYLNHDKAVLANLTLTNGLDDRGGGVFIDSNGGVVSNCLIVGNTSTSLVDYTGGGGVYTASKGRILNSDIVGNRHAPVGATTGKSGGGGILIANGSLVSNCLIAGNTSHLQGSGGGGGGGSIAIMPPRWWTA